MIQNNNLIRRIIDGVFIGLMLMSVVYFLLDLAFGISWMAVFIVGLQVPILYLVFWATNKYLKNKKVSKVKSYVISIAVLIVTMLAYFSLIMNFIIRNVSFSRQDEVHSTFLLKKSSVVESESQHFEYEVLETRFDFIYDLAKKQLFEKKEWQQEINYTPIDPKQFNAVEAYQKFYEDEPMGTYLLFYPDKIIVVTMEQPVAESQIDEIKELYKKN